MRFGVYIAHDAALESRAKSPAQAESLPHLSAAGGEPVLILHTLLERALRCALAADAGGNRGAVGEPFLRHVASGAGNAVVSREAFIEIEQAAKLDFGRRIRIIRRPWDRNVPKKQFEPRLWSSEIQRRLPRYFLRNPRT